MDHIMDAELLGLATARFLAIAQNVEREYRRASSTRPESALANKLIDAFWTLMKSADEHSRTLTDLELAREKSRLRAALFPVVGKSRFFSRSFLKPQGYAGDFLIVEWMYDLEGSDCHDPYQSAFVNSLDGVFQTIHSVVSIWERRHWLARLIATECEERLSRQARIRVLDIACGGGRYLADALHRVAPGLRERIDFVLCDQDPAALSYARSATFADSCVNLTTHCTPIKHLPRLIQGLQFDVIVASGLFDYFDRDYSVQMLTHLHQNLSPGGVLAFTNYTPEDASKVAKEWVADWSLILKDEEVVAEIIRASGLTPHVTHSENRSLVMATGRATRLTCNP
ncbi:MAG: class I SAM-dependent methyltransferase [Panacagrimonas sp.]